MSTSTKKPVKPAVNPNDKFVTKEQFNDFAADVLAAIKNVAAPAAITPEAVKEEKEILAAGPDKYQVNEEWDAIARDIIGEAVDHTEQKNDRSGGMKFTVVIKNEFSNAGPDYLNSAKQDRRTKDVAQEGEEGVKIWCKLINANLARRTANTQN